MRPPVAPSARPECDCSVGQEGGQAVWRLVADVGPEELVRCIDFRYITDCVTAEEALAMLEANDEARLLH